MLSDLKYEYYVTQLTDHPYDGQHVVVPKSWIPAYDSDDEMGVVKYPHSPLVGLEQWVEDKEDYCEDWGNFAGFVKYGDDSYEKAKEYIKRLAPNIDEEPQVKRKKIEEQNPGDNEIQLKQLQIVLQRIDMSTEQHEHSQRYENDEETNPSSEEVSLINTSVPQDKPNMETMLLNCNNNMEELNSLVSNMTLGEATSEKLLNSLRIYLSDFEEKYVVFDALRTNFGELKSVMKKIIDYLMDNKIKVNNTPNTSKDYDADGEVNKFKQTEQKEGIEISKTNENASIVMNSENSSNKVKENQQKEGILLHNLIDTTSDLIKLKGNQEQGKNFVSDDKSENPLGALENLINTQKEQEEIKSQINNEMEEEAGQLYIVIDTDEENTADIENNSGQFRHLHVKEPLECNDDNIRRDDSKTRGTLKHSERKKDLVELIKGSGVYVDERRLRFSTSTSSNSISLAQRLILEVFSLDAIEKCEIILGEKSIEGIQGLDAYALGILMRFVKQYSFDQNYMQSDSDIFHAIQKTIMYTKNKMELKKTKYIEDKKAADNTAQFFLKSLC